MIVKGVTNGHYTGNLCVVDKAGGVGISIYLNDAAGGTECKNISILYNMLSMTGGSRPYYIPSIDTDGFLHVNANRIWANEPAQSNILGVSVDSDYVSLRERWEAAGYPYNETQRMRKWEGSPLLVP